MLWKRGLKRCKHALLLKPLERLKRRPDLAMGPAFFVPEWLFVARSCRGFLTRCGCISIRSLLLGRRYVGACVRGWQLPASALASKWLDGNS